jgi:hypothetical protein
MALHHHAVDDGFIFGRRICVRHNPVLLGFFHQKRDQFGDLLFSLGLIIAGNRGRQAMVGMIGKQFAFDFAERRLRRLHLRQHVNTISVLINHFSQAPDLAFNPREAAANAGPAEFSICVHCHVFAPRLA